MNAAIASGRDPGRPWTWWLFVVLEVVAVLAVPVVALVGARALLDTRAGTFVTGPGPTDPGYQALVEPSPTLAVLERLDGELTGATVVSRVGETADGGAALLVPAELVIEDRTLAGWADDGDRAAADALGRALRLDLDEVVSVDDGDWSVLLDQPVTVTNPDPVRAGRQVRFPTGTVELEAGDVADWLGLSGSQEASALLFRRLLFWEALLDQGVAAPLDDAQPAATLAAVAAGPHTVELLPEVIDGGDAVVDVEAAEALITEVVPFPAGAQPGDRLRVRVLDRTGEADLTAVARAIARAGGEVVVVGNAGQFDGRDTEAVIADAGHEPAVLDLLARLGTGTVTVSPESDDTIDVTVLAGPDLLRLASG